MANLVNPFVTKGYAGAAYFCDREQETNLLTSLLINGNNIALMSPRRMGKTGLILHCFDQPRLKQNYYTFLIDIYSTKSMKEFVYEMGKAVLDMLKPHGKKALDLFLSIVTSLRAGVTYDQWGSASWGLELGDIQTPQVTLDEIFRYLGAADKPCIVAIDEFQSIARYPEENIEAVLRTYVQHCTNATFIFAGSQRTMMGQIFSSPSRPFYQSVVSQNIGPIPLEKYAEFIRYHFEEADRHITDETIEQIYRLFDGVTWYVQQMANLLYMLTHKGDTCTIDMIPVAIDILLNSNETTYNTLLFQLNEKPKQLLTALCKDGVGRQLTSAAFVKRHRLSSPSSVQSSLKILLEKELVTQDADAYYPYDKLFALWLNRKLNR